MEGDTIIIGKAVHDDTGILARRGHAVFVMLTAAGWYLRIVISGVWW